MKKEEQKQSTSTGDYDQFTRCFLEREDCLLLISQLNQLVKAVQRHRGISMGILAGNEAFLNEFQSLRSQLERRLATLESFARTNQLLTNRDKQNLSLAWKTIRNNWEGDKLNDNFELHSHFISQLLAMIAGLSKNLQVSLVQPMSPFQNTIVQAAFSPARVQQQRDILDFATKTLPDMIEQTARMRGTAAYAAVASMAGLDERKVRFWLATLSKSNDTLRKHAEYLSEETAGAMASLDSLKANELQLLQFIHTVDAALFGGSGGRQVAHNLFNMATDIIEVYWQVVRDGLDLVQAWHRQDLEAWVLLA